MNRINIGRIANVLSVALVLVIVACGGGKPEEHTFNLAIQEKSLSQSSRVLKVKQDDMVTIVVSTDEHVSFHLHGYDIKQEATPDQAATLAFTADATGSFPFTIHVVEGIHEGEESYDEAEVEDEEKEEGHDEEVEVGRLEVQPR